MAVPSETVEYIQAAPKCGLQLVVVGKDPFPSHATGVPFCKGSWAEQGAPNSTGRIVLEAIGLELHRAEQQFDSPLALLNALRDMGVVFLNASYNYVGGKLTKRDHLPLLREAHTLNGPVLLGSATIVLCGEASKIEWVCSSIGGLRAVHLDLRNKNNPARRPNWNEYWAKGALRDKAKLDYSRLFSCRTSMSR